MMTKNIHSTTHVFAVACLLLLGAFRAVDAQSSPNIISEKKPASLELTYDYIHTNGPPGGCGCINLNGGGIAYVQPLRNWNFSLLGSLTATHAGSIGLPAYSLTLVTYTAGARYIPRLHSALFQPYVEVQVGGVHASGTLASTPSLAGSSISSSFAATGGGGINLLLSRRFAFKLVDAEYLTNNYANGSTDHQNDVRISSGLVLNFCGIKSCVKDK